MIDRLSLLGGALLGGLATFLVFGVVNGVFLLPRAEERGRIQERAALDAATTIAIGELTHEADRARVARRLCLERGGLYRHATGECLEKPAK